MTTIDGAIVDKLLLSQIEELEERLADARKAKNDSYKKVKKAEAALLAVMKDYWRDDESDYTATCVAFRLARKRLENARQDHDEDDIELGEVEDEVEDLITRHERSLYADHFDDDVDMTTVKSIEVSGCGVDEVNGTYVVRNVETDRYPIFVLKKDGKIYSLYRDFTDCWVINTKFTPLYRSNGTISPIDKDWEPAHGGIEPCPFLKVKEWFN